MLARGRYEEKWNDVAMEAQNVFHLDDLSDVVMTEGYLDVGDKVSCMLTHRTSNFRSQRRRTRKKK